MKRSDRDLDGWWLAIEGRLGGVRLPDEALGDLALRFADGGFAFGTDSGRIVVNRHARPTMMDIIPMHGPNEGHIVPAIVEYDEHSLRICCDLSGRRRPTAFIAPAGTRHFLATYRRAARIPQHAPESERSRPAPSASI